MKILSAIEDFEQVSLSSFVGVLERLRYLAGLRNREGVYSHWGLSKAYGEEAVAAMAKAHSRVFCEYLSSPLEKLAGEVLSAAEKAGIASEVYVAQLKEGRDRLLPQVRNYGSPKHSDAVLLALQKIVQSGRFENRRSA